MFHFQNIKPFFVGVTAMVWVEAVDTIALISDLTKLVLQLIIGVLTIVYLTHKILNIKKQNAHYDKIKNDN